MIKSSNVTIRLSSDGRITIPREIRRVWLVDGQAELKVEINDDKLTLSPIVKFCANCGTTESVKSFVDGEDTFNLCDRCSTGIEKALHGEK